MTCCCDVIMRSSKRKSFMIFVNFKVVLYLKYAWISRMFKMYKKISTLRVKYMKIVISLINIVIKQSHVYIPIGRSSGSNDIEIRSIILKMAKITEFSIVWWFHCVTTPYYMHHMTKKTSSEHGTYSMFSLFIRPVVHTWNNLATKLNCRWHL